MIEFEVRSKKMAIGKSNGKTVYYAYPKSTQKLTNRMVVKRIVRDTSLSAGDVSSALTSLSSIIRDALLMGASIDLADLGSFRVLVSSKMIEEENKVTAETLKKPRIVFTPKMQMREAAQSVELAVDNPLYQK